VSELARLLVREAVDGRLVVRVEGEVDASNAGAVLQGLESALTEPELLVDLSGLGYLDSAGVRVLYALAESAAVRRTRVSLAVPENSPVRRVLEVAGVNAVLPLETRAVSL